MLGENAVDVYGFDLATLTPIAERVGHRLVDVLSVPTTDADADPAFHWIRRPA
jgi:hypothetical protein